MSLSVFEQAFFRVREQDQIADQDNDLGNLGEIIAYPPKGIPSTRDNDPCDEVLPLGRGTTRASVR